jgi:phosphoserine phosphatase
MAKRGPPAVFAFDLDGTVTQQEILPLIATELGLKDEMSLLTRLTLEGAIPFEASFRLRCAVLRSIPISTVQEVVAAVTVDPDVEAFIRDNRERCAIVTGNLRCWVRPILDRLNCKSFTSEGRVEGDRLVDVAAVLNKGRALGSFGPGAKRVAIGDSYNDIPMFEVADVGVAFGGTHDPVPALVALSDYVVFEGGTLCRLLSTL